VEITETYVPGRNLGQTRTVTVGRIPATQVECGGETDTHVTAKVFDRIQTLIERALKSNDAADQSITYTASDPGAPVDTRPWHERFPSTRRHRTASAIIT